jgi:hypothetical protein
VFRGPAVGAAVFKVVANVAPQLSRHVNAQASAAPAF